MSALGERLRRLQKQAGQRPAAENAQQSPHAIPPGGSAAEAATVPTPPVDSPKITALRRALGLRERARVGCLPAAPASGRELPGEEIANGLRYRELRVSASAPPTSLWLPGSDEAEIPAARLIAFDTETTGLAGGSGTRAFMIGAADWLGTTIRVRQLCITTLAAEPAMLREFAGWLETDSVLLSYNGRSYDAPLLRTRYRLAWLPDGLAGLRHVDLLHPTRRRFRHVWENCRLATVEHRLLGIRRDDDLPGAEAPAAWRDYLRGGDSRRLQQVFAHNAQDVQTLLVLLNTLADPTRDDAAAATPALRLGEPTTRPEQVLLPLRLAG